MAKAKKKTLTERCDDCGSMFVNGSCPSPEEHESQVSAVSLMQNRLLTAERQRSEARLAAKSLRLALDEKEEELQRAHIQLSLYEREWNQSPAWLSTEKRDKVHHGTLLAFMSDTHYGEVVNPREMGGTNAYNMEIAEQRTQRFFDKTIMLARNYTTGVKYDGIVLALGGDLVSGDIHDELVETNEMSTYNTIETVIPWLLAGISKWVDAFGKVHIVSAPGNHGRNSKKPRHKGRSANNADSHIAKTLAIFYDQMKEKNVTFNIPESADVDFKIYDYGFVLEHGDAFKSTTGSQIGALGPAKRGTIAKQNAKAREDKPFDYMLMGHYHQFIPAYTQGFVMNGSLKGYDEYAKNLALTPEQPQQGLLIVTPEHGITGTYPILVSKQEKEGW